MELLLTGSTGFVGRNLLLRLLADRRWDRLILPVRSPQKLKAQLAGEGIGWSNLEGRLQIVAVSDDDWKLPESINPDLVIHAAGLLFGREREEYFWTNVEGSLNLAAQLPDHTRMIVLSSLAAGGPTPQGETSRTIDHPDRPVSYYGASKLAMEKVLREKLGSRLLILRPPMVLGPRDTATVPLFQMARGLVRVKPGFRPKHYSWIAVDDLCEALLAVAGQSWLDHKKPYYLTVSSTITDGELIKTAARVLKKSGMTIPIPQLPLQLLSLILDAVPAWRTAIPSLGRDRVRELLQDRWVCDGGEFAKCFGWMPQRDFTETLAATADWLKTS